MFRLKSGTWVLVADGEKALIMENRGSAAEPRLSVRRKETQVNPPDREQATDRPGRMPDGPSVHRSAVDETDWHELEKERFASDLAELLYKQAHHGAFDGIVLVAGPQILGQIREKLHPEVVDRVIAEVPKVLTNHTTDEIERLVLDSLNEQEQ